MSHSPRDPVDPFDHLSSRHCHSTDQSLNGSGTQRIRHSTDQALNGSGTQRIRAKRRFLDGTTWAGGTERELRCWFPLSSALLIPTILPITWIPSIPSILPIPSIPSILPIPSVGPDRSGG